MNLFTHRLINLLKILGIERPNSFNEEHSEGFRKGDLIGDDYEIHDMLGKGGFGEVYLVYSRSQKRFEALKTFRQQFMADETVRNSFRNEAELWINLHRHPFIAQARAVDEFNHRLFLVLEYVPKNNLGINSLEDYLRYQPPDFDQALQWAIQICYGMEYAYSKGMKCHRDIKPSNILISPNKIIKISDFGLANVLTHFHSKNKVDLMIVDDKIGLSVQTVNGIAGTPTHMAPEQFLSVSACDERTDIYSIGIVLYQMRFQGKLPFNASPPSNRSPREAMRFWDSLHKLHRDTPIPNIQSRLFRVIHHCLEKEPSNRYQSFNDLRNDLEAIFQKQTGQRFEPPNLKEFYSFEWSEKGASLARLGKNVEAIQCFDKAIELSKELGLNDNVYFYLPNKGLCLEHLGRYQEALSCFDETLAIRPQATAALNGKAIVLSKLGRYEEANSIFDTISRLDPTKSEKVLLSKGINLNHLNQQIDAIKCFDQILHNSPQNLMAWYSKGLSLHTLGRHSEAISCLDKALFIDPLYLYAWFYRGLACVGNKQWNEAIESFEKVESIQPKDLQEQSTKEIAKDKLQYSKGMLAT